MMIQLLLTFGNDQGTRYTVDSPVKSCQLPEGLKLQHTTLGFVAYTEDHEKLQLFS